MIDSVSLENIQDFLRGINRFYDQFSYRKLTNKVLWQEDSTKVIDYSCNPKAELPILFFIPSLVNKSYILDLSEENSLCKYFAKLGYRVYLLDFSEPIESELSMGFLDYQVRIEKAITEVCGQDRVVTIGYCLGGLFSCAINSRKKTNLVGQILIALPWDFTHLQHIFGLNNALIFHKLISMSEDLDKISPVLIQLFFSSIAPNRIWDKFCQFSMMRDAQEINKFLAIEQWVNDGIGLSKKFALESLSMIINNSLKNKEFKLDGQPIIIEDSQLPCLIINGSEDKIVPVTSSMPLYILFSNKEIMIEKTGHIGLIVSKLAKEKIWPKMEQWLKRF